MTFFQAYKEAKKLQQQVNNGVVKVVYKNYSGYNVEIEPIDLAIIKSSLGMMKQTANSFKANVGSKYGR